MGEAENLPLLDHQIFHLWLEKKNASKTDETEESSATGLPRRPIHLNISTQKFYFSIKPPKHQAHFFYSHVDFFKKNQQQLYTFHATFWTS